MKRLFTILALLLFGLLLQAQIVLQSKLDSDSMMIGEQQVFSIALVSSSPLQSVVPDLQKLENSGLEILSAMSDSLVKEEKHIYYYNFLITVFDSGNYVLPSIPVLINEQHRIDTLFSEELPLIVYSPEVDTTKEIRDIKDPVKTPFKISELFPYAPYIGGVLLIALLVFLYVRYKRRLKNPEKEKEKIPAHIKAFHNLDLIKEKKLWQQGKVKDYYVELSDTVRAYIEDRYGIAAMESVTYEILDNFKQYSYDDEMLIEMLESLLNLSDLVKFAKENPNAAENEIHLNQAYIFVEKTKVIAISQPIEVKTNDDQE